MIKKNICKFCKWNVDEVCRKPNTPDGIKPDTKSVELCGYFESIVDCNRCCNLMDTYCVLMIPDPATGLYYRRDISEVKKTKKCDDFERRINRINGKK
jgi:hypothetical protein